MSEYIKEVIDNGSWITARVLSMQRTIIDSKQFSYIFFNTLKNKEKNFKKAHKWADAVIVILIENEAGRYDE